MVLHEALGFILFFVLSSFYRRLVCRRFIDVVLVVTFYLCGGDSDKQVKFDQSKISNYGRQYVEELELQLF